MRAFIQTLGLSLAGLLLASCGGGGGSGSQGPFQPTGISVSVSPASGTTTPLSLVGVTVQVRNPNGTPFQDGTQVTLAVSPPGVGLVSSTNPVGPPSDSITTTTTGGLATFRFHSRSVGRATLTATVTNPTAPAQTVNATASINVDAGPPNDPRLTLSAVTTTIPVNILNLDPFVGSPYLTEVTVTRRNIDGTLVGTGGVVSVSINPVNPTGGFTTLDDPDTALNEFQVRLGQGPVDIVAGRANVFFNSFNLPATAVMTVTAIDSQTGETVSAQLTFQIVSGAPNLPASIGVIYDGLPVYIASAGGNASALLQALVVDGAGAFVPNPPAGTNNVTFEILGGAQGGERLVGVNAAGATVSGSSVSVRTLNGIASVSYQSGTREGLVTIRATSDRSDNNVDNGIADPIIGQRGLTVSDGRLFDLIITQPAPEVLSGDGSPDGFGTYSSLITVLATDRRGNPVVPGTEIKFGLIDSPKVPGTINFAIRGNDGDPQELGTLFTAPSGQFVTAGGGAGPGDTLVVFGSRDLGTRDLKSARTVQQVLSQTSLTVTYRFNPNDDTGQVVDRGPVLPYVIGRATLGNIQQSARTDEFGVATAILTYPASALGTQVVVWAQGSGIVVNGLPKLVSDARFIRFSGTEQLSLTADPNTIPGNTTANVRVCALDGNGIGLREVAISFIFEDLDGTGSVNGVPTAGTLPQLTGTDGCLTAAVTTNGVTTNLTPRVVFRAGDQSVAVSIVLTGQLLQLSPAQRFGDQSQGPVTITLLNFSGTGVPGVFITGSCTSTGNSQLTLDVLPGVTNASGQTTAVITSAGFECRIVPQVCRNDNKTPANAADDTNSCDPDDGIVTIVSPEKNNPPAVTGSCTFQTASGPPTAVFVVKPISSQEGGIDFSPSNGGGAGDCES